MAQQPVYQSQVPFDTARVGAAALYCSDGRYGDQMDEYLHLGCNWPRYDRLAVPGGPAVLSGNMSVLWEESFIRRSLEYLVRSHQLKYLALIAHEACGFYRDWLHVPAEQTQQRQIEDLQQARQRLRLTLPNLEVRLLLARKHDGRVQLFDVGGGTSEPAPQPSVVTPVQPPVVAPTPPPPVRTAKRR